MTLQNPQSKIQNRVPVGGSTAPEDPGRRGCLLIGAFLGVGVGVIVALFIMPRVFDRYFGTADVELGATHSADGKRIKVERYDERPGSADSAVIVVSSIQATGAWDPGTATVLLEFEDGTIVGSPAISPAGALVPGAEERRTFIFRRPAGNSSKPKLLSFSEPKARFYLQPGKPE